jgi:hypothetical protein
MNTLLASVLGAILATSVHAQTTANSPAIGQAVSGNNAAASGTSGTGVHTDGTVSTGSKHGATGREAAGVNASGQVVGKGTAVIGTTPQNAARTNAQATNTMPPAGKVADAPATGGRGQGGSRAEKEISHANALGVKEVPGDRIKTTTSEEKGKEQKAKASKADRQGRSENAR